MGINPLVVNFYKESPLTVQHSAPKAYALGVLCIARQALPVYGFFAAYPAALLHRIGQKNST